MRIRRLFIPLLIPHALCFSQYPLTTLSTTLVDALSADPNYQSLLRLLQRARLIPTLNKLTNATLFAPTNDAIKEHLKENLIWQTILHDEEFLLTDNVHEQLRQQLFYHLLNRTLLELPSDEDAQAYKTLHYPRIPLEPPSKDPPPFPPWLPVPGGALGGEPQRLRVIGNDKEASVGVDAFGRGGTKIINRTEAGNGVVYGIAQVLEPPPDLARVVSQQGSLSYFRKIMTDEIMKLLNSTSELSLFLPVDDAWESMDPLQRNYLESDYAADDLARILNMHAVLEKKVRYSKTFGKSTNLTTVDGSNLEIIASNGNTTVANATLVQPDIYAANGVLHLVDSLLIPPGAFKLTPEKYLLALNCTTFVSLLHSVNLTSLVNDTESKYTILAPSDDVLSLKNEELPEKGSDELRRLLQYHFIPGRWTEKKLSHAMLLETALKEAGLDGGRQVLSVEVGSGEKKTDSNSIRFGGAGTVGNPVELDNHVIYFLSRPIVPPVDPLQTALPQLDLSSFLAAIFSTSQAETLKTSPHTTLLIPHNTAFKRLGMLVSAHFLAASSKSDLEKVLLHHALNTVQYAQTLQKGSQHTFATLEGSDIQIDQSNNGTLYANPSGGWKGMRAAVYLQDSLTSTGVIHEMSDILIPRSVNLTIEKLVKAAQGSIMASMAVKAGFEWVLNNTAPPEDSPWAGQGLPSAGWTLLCPTDNAFKKLNLAELYADFDGLRSIVSQHLIPSLRPVKLLELDGDSLYNNRPLPLDDSPTYTTLHSAKSAYGDLVFHPHDDPESEGYIVGIKGARGTDSSADWARVLSWGRSTGAGGGGVIQIDRLLRPYYPPWWIAYGAPLTVTIIGVLVICSFFYGVRIIWRRDTTEPTYEPVGGFPDNEG